MRKYQLASGIGAIAVAAWSFGVAATSSSNAHSVTPTIELTTTIVPPFVSQSADMQSADFDGDGLPELVVPARGTIDTAFHVVGYTKENGLVLKQSVAIDDLSWDENEPVSFATWTSGSVTHLLVRPSSNGRIIEYAGWPLRKLREITLETTLWPISGMAVGDIDNDGKPEIVGIGNAFADPISVFSLENGDYLWHVLGAKSTGSKVLLAQLDADPALEIVAGDERGIVIDGATHAIEWTYESGFGRLMAEGKFDASNAPGFVSASVTSGFSIDRVEVFKSAPWLSVWNSGAYPVLSLTSADVDRDGIDEIVVGHNGVDDVSVYDGQTGILRSRIPEQSVVNIAFRDFDGDGNSELAMVVGGYGAPAALHVRSPGSETFNNVIPARSAGPFRNVIFDPYSKSESPALIYSATNARFPGLVTSLDAKTGQVRWRTPSYTNDQLDEASIVDLHLARRAGGMSPLVVAAVNLSSHQARILAVDSASGESVWVLGSGNQAFRAILGGSLLLDHDNDGLSDSVATCTEEVRLREYRLSDRAPIWTTAEVGSQSGCSGMLSFRSGGRLFVVVVVGEGLRAYDADTRKLVWSLSRQNLGATFINNGVSGPEIVLRNPDTYQITFLSAATGNVLRTLSLDFGVVAVTQEKESSIHELIVAYGGKLAILDGETGVIRRHTDSLAADLGADNRIATLRENDQTVLVATPSNVAVFLHTLDSRDRLFKSSFEFSE